MKLIVSWKDEDKKLQEMERVYDKEIISIGRNIRNDFCIPDRFASSYHARIESSAGKYRLHDLGSTNGTSLNGEKLEQNGQKVIKDGDIIKISEIDIKFVSKKRDKKSTKAATPSMHKAAYNSLNEILNHFIRDAPLFASEGDIEAFCGRIQDVIEILCEEFYCNLEIYSKLQYELDVNEKDTARRKYNPLKMGETAQDVAKYLLDWKLDDKLSAKNFLKKACGDSSCSQKAVLTMLESVLPALLNKISPDAIQSKLHSSKQNQDSRKGVLEKLLKQPYKDLWNEYVRNHRELTENKNKRFEIIKEEFQINFQNLLDEEKIS